MTRTQTALSWAALLFVILLMSRMPILDHDELVAADKEEAIQAALVAEKE